LLRLAPLLWFAAAASGCGDPETSQNRPPLAFAGLDQRVLLEGADVFVRLDGTESRDPDGDGIRWYWRVVRAPDVLFVDTGGRTEGTLTVTLRERGLHVFALEVDDGLLRSAPDYVNVWVVDALQAPDVPDGGLGDGGVGDGGVADTGLGDGAATPPDGGGLDGTAPDAAR
jgi:hypothetical protein